MAENVLKNYKSNDRSQLSYILKFYHFSRFESDENFEKNAKFWSQNVVISAHPLT